MLEPPDVKHAMEVAKKQSNVSSPGRTLRAPVEPVDPKLVHIGLVPLSGIPNFLSGSLKNMVV